MRSDRRTNAARPYVIPCRECAAPLDLDPDRIERLAGRAFIECPSCLHLIWVRRTDLRAAIRAGAR